MMARPGLVEGGKGRRHLPHPLLPPDQNKELRLPLTG